MIQCFKSLLLNEMQIKTTRRYHPTPEWPSSKRLQRINPGEAVEERELSYSVGGNVNWYSHHGEQYRCSLITKKIAITWSVNSTPGVYPQKMLICDNNCPSTFTVALFATSKTWKKPKCALTDEWLKNMWYIHIIEDHPATIKNETVLYVGTWMGLEIAIVSEISQTKTSIIWHAESKIKMWYKWTYLPNRKGLTDLENKLMVIKSKGFRGKLGVWD